jgi:hypothetical protein
MALKTAILAVSLSILNGSFCLASYMFYKIVHEGYTPISGITSLDVFTFASILQCASRCSNLNGLCRGFIYQSSVCVNISTSNNNCQLVSFADPSLVTLGQVKNVCRRFYVADPWNNEIAIPEAGKLSKVAWLTNEKPYRLSKQGNNEIASDRRGHCDVRYQRK